MTLVSNFSLSLFLSLSPVIYIYIYIYRERERERMCSHDVMFKAMECRIVVSEFVLQSRYYVLFRANILPSYGLNSTTTVLLGE